MRTLQRCAVAGLAILLLGTVACGSPQDSDEAASRPVKRAVSVKESQPEPEPTRHHDCALLTQGLTVTFVATDNFFAPECATLRSDAKLTVRNVGVRPHTLTISEGDFGQKPWKFHLAVSGGKSVTSKGPLSDGLEPGTYEFFCTRHAGMDGVLIVMDPVS